MPKIFWRSLRSRILLLVVLTFLFLVSRGDQLVYIPSQPPRGDALLDRASSCQRGLQSRTELCRSSDR